MTTEADGHSDRERWQETERIYHQALEQAPSARAALLDTACADDVALRQTVESLLACEPPSATFLEVPALDVVAELLTRHPDVDFTGRRIGPYVIHAWLGSGGMGDVYRARDGHLQRDVALKILPVLFVRDPDRLARFKREAQVLASLNHPNIAAIYSFEDADGLPVLALELVVGPTLAERLSQGPLALEETLRIATQIADALAAAHDQGVIHRDLKPANLTVRPDGTVKVLDFGLAKAMDPPAAMAPDVPASLAITPPPMTQAGMILGTAAYMSPEQAKSQPVDRRTDLWAFGCVLYEMITGQRPFFGETLGDTLALVLTKEPDWTALPPDTPAAIERLLRRCLEKDRRQRLDSASSARLEIEEALAPPASARFKAFTTTSALPRPHARLPWVIATASAIFAVAAFALWAPWRLNPEPAKVSFEIQAPTSSLLTQTVMAVSPDGRLLIARIGSADRSGLGIRPLASTTWSPIPDTASAFFPFWSPDSQHVGFWSDGQLKTIDVGAPTPRTLVDTVPVRGYGGAWSRDGVILFAKSTGPLFRIPAAGGQPVQTTELDSVQGEIAHRFPRFLPDGDHFLYLALSTKPGGSGIYLGSLTSRATRRIVSSGTRPDFAPPNLLLFLREGTLMVQPLDRRTLDVMGEPVPVATGLLADSANGAAGFSVSANGVLAVRLGSDNGGRQLTWTDAKGLAAGTIGNPGGYENPRLSPDGKRLAAFRQEDGADIWLTDLARSTSTRFTFDPAIDNIPVWSPDGRSIAFSSNRDGGVFNLYRKSAGGTGADELLLKTAANKLVNDWSADGRSLLYEEESSQTKTDVWMVPLSGDRTPTRLLGTPFNESEAAVSPDGRWMAYVSDESGVRQVYVQTFPPAERKWQVSNLRTSAHPRWRADGKQLFFDASGTLYAVDVVRSPDEEFKAGVPHGLFPGLLNLGPHNFDIVDLGRRFLVVLPPQTALPGAQPIVVTINWTSGLHVGR